MADDAHIGYAPSRIFGTPTTMLWVYRLGLEHAKQFLLSGDAIDAETAHRIGLVAYLHPADELEAAVETFARRFEHISADQLALNKLLINQAFENMGLRTSQLLGTFFDGVTRHTEEAYRWVESFDEKAFAKSSPNATNPSAITDPAPASPDSGLEGGQPGANDIGRKVGGSGQSNHIGVGYHIGQTVAPRDTNLTRSRYRSRIASEVHAMGSPTDTIPMLRPKRSTRSRSSR